MIVELIPISPIQNEYEYWVSRLIYLSNADRERYPLCIAILNCSMSYMSYVCSSSMSYMSYMSCMSSMSLVSPDTKHNDRQAGRQGICIGYMEYVW